MARIRKGYMTVTRENRNLHACLQTKLRALVRREETIQTQNLALQQFRVVGEEQEQRLTQYSEESKRKDVIIANLIKRQQELETWFQFVHNIRLPLPLALPTRFGKRKLEGFPFLTLPGELRNRIYIYALVANTPIDIWPILPRDNVSRSPSNRLTHSTILQAAVAQINTNLLLVSLQVHREAVPVLYGVNRFRFSDTQSLIALQAFLDHIRSNTLYLSNISIRYGIRESYLEYTTDADDRARRRDMQVLFNRLIKIQLHWPIAPVWHVNTLVEGRVDEIVRRLPALPSFTMVVPHSLRIRIVGNGNPDDPIEGYLKSRERYRFESAETGHRKVKKTLLFLRRDASQPLMHDVFSHINVDDDEAMGRDRLRQRYADLGWEFRQGYYTAMGSYAVDGDEDEIDVGIPGNFVLPTIIPFHLRTLQFARNAVAQPWNLLRYAILAAVRMLTYLLLSFAILAFLFCFVDQGKLVRSAHHSGQTICPNHKCIGFEKAFKCQKVIPFQARQICLGLWEVEAPGVYWEWSGSLWVKRRHFYGRT